MSKAMTRKAWLEYLKKAVDEFDWDAAGQEQDKPYGYVRADGGGLFIYGEHQFQNTTEVELLPVYLHPKQEQGEPIGYTDEHGNAYQYGYTGPKFAPNIQLYTKPQPAQKPWVGLTDEERDAIFECHHTRLGGWDYSGDEVMYDQHFEDAVAAIEAKLKEKNT